MNSGPSEFTDLSPFGSSTTLSFENGTLPTLRDGDSFSDNVTSNDQLVQDPAEDEPEPEPESQDHQPNYTEEEDDPLGVKKLALSFDYLVYQITEKVQSLALQTEDTVKYKKQVAETQLNEVEESITSLNKLLKACEDLDNDFTKLEQISLIVTDFKTRIRQLESYFKKV
jgi:hypothetical protein